MCKSVVLRCQKFIAAILGFALAVGCLPVAAFAENTCQLSISGLDEGAVVTFYKVASYQNGAGYQWLIDSDRLPNIEKRTDDLTKWSSEEANLIVQRAVGAAGTLSCTSAAAGANGEASITASERGIWAATVANTSIATSVYQNMIIALNNTAEDIKLEAKKSTVTLLKDAQDKSVGTGETVRFSITTTEPVYASDATQRVYTINDILPDGLNFLSIETVADEGCTYTEGSDYELTENGKLITIDFTSEGIRKFAPGHSITTTLLATREPGYNGALTNNASIRFSTDSYSTNITEGPSDESQVYDFNLAVVKVAAGSEGTKLTGAEFTLKNSTTGKYVQADGMPCDTATKLAVNSEGTLVIKGLDEASYELTEVSAPDGYIITDSPMRFSIVASYNGKTLTGYNIVGDKTATGTVAANGNNATITVQNTKQGLLPKTGEAGSLALAAGGIALLATGIALYAWRKLVRENFNANKH